MIANAIFLMFEVVFQAEQQEGGPPPPYPARPSMSSSALRQGHVVQQAQGRVKPTMQMKEGVAINDDSGLEREADVMSEKALRQDMPG
ncbi:hypothetical protein RO07_20755 [Pandoraea pulmonicola]|uniref:Uncharacterized protein n=2 Tax=Pandoraea pulmonicola TaxID=93221 RepID=A0ABN4ES28_PANPU|nr:hypothetical protein RO07_20755 [Pandoraea pulmonicola]